MRNVLSLIKLFIALFFVAILLVAGVGLFALYQYKPNLPDVHELREVRFQIPLRIFSADGKLMAEYGEQRRTPIRYDQIPDSLRHAILAAEDSRFYEHFGIDIKGLARAAFQLASSGEIQTGGSTITMQVAKNFFLTPERTFTRKFNEILLSLNIEKELSKEEILELYVNKIYLGQRAYGVQAAANIYYGRDISELSLAQVATIAGLPKAPSANNPVRNPQRSTERRNWILGRMLSLGYISQAEYEEAVIEPEVARYHFADIELSAFYVAEMVRAEMFRLYGDDAYTDGFNVTTTIDSRKQEAADAALRAGLIAYHERHGYHGPEAQVDISNLTLEQRLAELSNYSLLGNMHPALVISVEERAATLLLRDGIEVTLDWDAIRWAREFRSVNAMGPVPQNAGNVLSTGDVVRVYQQPDEIWRLTQLPRVQGGLVAMEPDTGAIRALSGGFSFNHNNFNRVTQAWRQPGSTFKPFLYAVALEEGYSAASIVNDSPIVIDDVSLGGEWRPENHSRDFEGPIRLREALYRSKNLVSIRLLRDIGLADAYPQILEFGFDAERTPQNLSLSLGASDATLLQVNTGYAAFANGGYRVVPWFIDEVTHVDGRPVELPLEAGDAFKHTNARLNSADPENYRILSESTAYIISDVLADVVRRGTGRRALALNRTDLAGKTGTTNQQRDAWFAGYNPNLVTTAWIGFDQPAPLGRSEYGGTAALPVWIDFMRVALEGKENAVIPRPENVVQARVDPATGLLAYDGQSDAIVEYFTAETLPRQRTKAPGQGSNSVLESLFD
ncbi:penicillin-binding protein 1A [Nitrincola schmidtii]|uniref:penicillin-binding protein 1A n=1 Tax=Nitrincola schmidtii TaxID=1730894 RepID=UPI00124CD988|nr:penicillin-binding protein 1A [Nitrincola schmidtii]